ncbi:MAG: antibiotic biosynthesis monooxygenase [Actinobacteria bacterium]|nr:antibiotic biosynthesis monooxygenase [Actinomycetota bacterium]
MPAITVIATAHAKPGRGNELLGEMKKNVLPVHQEPGCLHYSLHQASDDPDTIVVIERWASEDAITAHGQAPHMAAFRERAAPLRAAPTEVRRYLMIPAEGLPEKMRF